MGNGNSCFLSTMQGLICFQEFSSRALSDCNWTRSQNHLVRLRTKWFWVRVQLQSLKSVSCLKLLGGACLPSKIYRAFKWSLFRGFYRYFGANFRRIFNLAFHWCPFPAFRYFSWVLFEIISYPSDKSTTQKMRFSIY